MVYKSVIKLSAKIPRDKILFQGYLTVVSPRIVGLISELICTENIPESSNIVLVTDSSQSLLLKRAIDNFVTFYVIGKEIMEYIYC